MSGTYAQIYTAVDDDDITSSRWNTEFQNIITHADFSGLGDYSASTSEMQTQVDPYPAAAESLATDGAGELARLRYILAQHAGKTYWYQDPSTSLENLYTLLGASTSQAVLPAGSVGTPSVGVGGTTTGFYLYAAGAVGVTTAGVLAARFTNANGGSLLVGSSGRAYLYQDGSGDAVLGGASGSTTTYVHAGGSAMVYVTSTGKMGLGVSPTNTFVIKAASGDTRFDINTPAGASAYIKQSNTPNYDVTFMNENSGLVYIGQNATTRLYVSSTGIYPTTTNTYNCGDATNKWALVRGTTVTSGDLRFENDWVFIEGEKVGLASDGVVLVSPDGKRFRLNVTEVSDDGFKKTWADHELEHFENVDPRCECVGPCSHDPAVVKEVYKVA